MIASAVYFIGALAWLTSVLTIAGSFAFAFRDDVSHMVDVVGGLSAAACWVVFALGASALEVPVDAELIVAPAPMLSYLGAGGAVLMGAIALMGTTALLDVRGVDARV